MKLRWESSGARRREAENTFAKTVQSQACHSMKIINF